MALHTSFQFLHVAHRTTLATKHTADARRNVLFLFCMAGLKHFEKCSVSPETRLIRLRLHDIKIPLGISNAYIQPTCSAQDA